MKSINSELFVFVFLRKSCASRLRVCAEIRNLSFVDQNETVLSTEKEMLILLKVFALLLQLCHVFQWL